jgi:hypothetical protein
MALKYTIFTPPAMFAIEEYGGGNGGYTYQWRGHGPTYCAHLIVSLILVEWAHIAGGLMDHLTEHDTYRMVWHNGARWKGTTDPARAESVLERDAEGLSDVVCWRDESLFGRLTPTHLASGRSRPSPGRDCGGFSDFSGHDQALPQATPRNRTGGRQTHSWPPTHQTHRFRG